MAAIQTVFEGSEVNTFDRLRENQRRSGLPVLFGHAVADLASVDTVPTIMEAYCSGGTPWFVVIAPDGRVVYDRSLLAATGLDNALLLPSPLLSKSVLEEFLLRAGGKVGTETVTSVRRACIGSPIMDGSPDNEPVARRIR